MRPTFSMSLARKHFCTDVARENGGAVWPRKYGMNCSMPAPVSSRPDSGAASSDEERTRVCARSSKKRRKVSRISLPFTTGAS